MSRTISGGPAVPFSSTAPAVAGPLKPADPGRTVTSVPTPGTLQPDRRLAPPVGVDTSRLRWDYLVFFVGFHAMAPLVLLPYFFSWAGVIAFVAGVIVFGQLSIPIGYHRLLAHRSFRTPRWFERVLVTLAMCTAQETPAQWVAWHRKHHAHSDQQEDPHSPRVAFLWSHIRWLVHENRSRMGTYALYEKYARDVLADPYYRWMERLPSAAGLFFLAHALLYSAVTATAAVAAYGFTADALQLASSVVLWGVVVRTVWVWHITWSVNSISHLFGYRNYETNDDSRNNWFVTLLTAGEGWHNNHHADPASASVQHRWWEIDVNYYTIRLFGLLGLATHIIRPRHKRQKDGSGNSVSLPPCSEEIGRRAGGAAVKPR